MKDFLAQEALIDSPETAVIVTDQGFVPATGQDTLDLPPDAGLDDLQAALDTTAIVRIAFPGFADGRGFTLARRLRLMGFAGHLRAHGHVLADQYAMARRCGFDDVEISADLAARQSQDQWQNRANWQAHDHRSRLLRA